MNDLPKDPLEKSLEEALAKAEKKSYQSIVKETTPAKPYFKNALSAFFLGGVICCLGQVFYEIFLYYGAGKENATTFGLAALIILSALATGFGVYDKLAKFGGAGAIVPISGFANSMTAPALESKSEGFINGVGAKIFTIAGPVIVYGICGSILLGLLKYAWITLSGGSL